ncbi:hypothetical protein LXA47_05075 [Massilia sp. P8910]|uniref:hypothetical protein n=1 Tax=Massilia antarctica TaxID=2765360 RepID=UPI0006BB8351|nr:MULTISPECIES: hypothetical protein [Massilia]MCE3602976.1 hypothetical protein [Massilia antarctica]MCY0915492.1 hypothetical protein [Massilia sp. H27-R4]
MTGTSTLDPDNFPETPDRKLGSGHGTGALGPSDSSDSGSDLVGASGLARDDVLDLGSGTTSDLETGAAGGAGPDIGDPDLDSDTDASGTGERAAAGRDTTVRDGADIDVDHIESIPSVPLDEDDLAFMASAPPGQAPGGKKGAHP